MKKKYLVIGAFIFASASVKAQKSDSLFKKDTIKKIDIEVMYSHYLQDGNNSAVTGGIGTEKLTVYSSSVKIKTTANDKSSYVINGGADVITSASTDRIDFIISSASIHDVRAHGNVVYTKPIEKRRMTLSAGAGFSLESDYFSLPVILGSTHTSKNKMRSCSFDLQLYFDDLRWGKVNLDYPQQLIYPEELRTQEWHNTYRRQSYNFKTGIYQIINKRNRIAFLPEITYQHGLLSTPFHRVYFKDNALRVENLPSQRLKGLLGFKANSFAGGRTILKNALDLYADDFGVIGIAIENETSIKLNYKLTLSPFFRLYRQKASRYFAPYKQHLSNEPFYTSDYDLSTFTTYKAGLNVRYAPFMYLSKNTMFNEIQLRYAFYYRSNGLYAHMMSCVINGLITKRRK